MKKNMTLILCLTLISLCVGYYSVSIGYHIKDWIKQVKTSKHIVTEDVLSDNDHITENAFYDMVIYGSGEQVVNTALKASEESHDQTRILMVVPNKKFNNDLLNKHGNIDVFINSDVITEKFHKDSHLYTLKIGYLNDNNKWDNKDLMVVDANYFVKLM